jgi:hypothetical protein
MFSVRSVKGVRAFPFKKGFSAPAKMDKEERKEK